MYLQANTNTWMYHPQSGLSNWILVHLECFLHVFKPTVSSLMHEVTDSKWCLCPHSRHFPSNMGAVVIHYMDILQDTVIELSLLPILSLYMFL